MILVLLGTQKNSFERLLNEIKKCIEKGQITEKVVVQSGYTNFQSTEMETFKYIAKDKMQELICNANLIITHGGVGSIISCIKSKKKVIAVPRLSKFKEHVNDHQIQIVEDFDNKGFIKGVLDLENLGDTIANISKFTPRKFTGNNSKMLNIITDYIENN